ncbi:MAG TPA: hypothetical protein VMU04_20365 [Candidatus Acidoferrum sp.]|nr:hypothetical protein [Candidatus Acidoferrum sp.]
MRIKLGFLAAMVAALAWPGSARAGSFITDFNSGLPDGSTVLGNAIISTNDGTGGGYTNSGCLQLTTNINSQTGVFIITNDLDAGQSVVSFTARYKVLIGGGNGADGTSFNYAPDMDLTGNWTYPEEGSGTGLTVAFHTYYNASVSPNYAPSVDVNLFGFNIATVQTPLRTGAFVDAVIQLNPDSTLSVVYDGTYVYSNLDLSTYGFTPANGLPRAGSLFGFGARTGGLNDKHFIDNLSIITQTNASAYVQSFLPQGRKVPTNSAIDIVLTDNTTQVDTNTIALQLDGATVVPTITQDGASNTFIHFAPPTAFGYSSTHSVSLVFADNAALAPNTNTLQYGFTVVGAAPAPDLRIYTALFTEDFESYVGSTAPLDKNYASGANAAANGSGNPWFGPAPPNARVVSAENGVTPHGGNQMIRGSAPSDLDENWYNVAYRFNGGNNYMGNVMLDWWFYDPLGPGDSGCRDYVALGNYSTTPTTTDYPGTGSLNSGTVYQRTSLGMTTGTGVNLNVYQARIVGATDGLTSSGWFNTTGQRSVGWHHGRTVFGPTLADGTANYVFYIDDMVNPVFWHNSVSTRGLNVVEINTDYGPTSGYFDDVTFSVVATPPTPSASLVGTNLVLTWSGAFTLQSATNVVGPYYDIGSGSPFTNSVTTKPMQFFRLKN